MRHSKLVQLLTIVMLLASLQGFAAKMRKGPYLIYPNNPEKMVVMAQADGSATTSSIRWGTTKDYSTGTADMEVIGDDHQYRKIIEGLVPNTRYFYEIDLDGTKHTGSFRSAPAVDAKTAVIYAIGDTRNVVCDVNEILQSMLDDIDNDVEKRESIWIHCGDWCGKDGEDKWDGQFFNRDYPATLEAMRRIPIMGCRGNHEKKAFVYGKYWPYTKTVEETTVPVPPANQHYYSFDYGPAHIAVIDDNTSHALDSDQYKWLLADLKASTKPWTILQWHKPAYTAGGHGDSRHKQKMVKALQDAGLTIDVVNCGHSHFYSRVEIDGVIHLTTGGGGADRNKNPKSPSGNIKASYRGLSFARMEMDGSRLLGEVKNEKGQVVDVFSAAKGPKLSYDPIRFVEAVENDGSIENTTLIILEDTDATFTADVVSGGYVTAKNVPKGLTAKFVRDSDTNITMSLTGKAEEHANDGVRKLQVLFSSKAFKDATGVKIAFTTQNYPLLFANPKVIKYGDDWRYMKGTNEPPSNWNELAFDDSAWLIGPTLIGYGGKRDATVLKDMKGNYSTVYTRCKFRINNPKSVTLIELNINYSAAFVAYVNGTLVSSSRYAPKTFTHKSLSLKRGGGTAKYDITEKALSLLKKGDNVLSVVVFSKALDSKRTAIAAELSIGGDSK